MITVENLSKSYADQILIEQASFFINPKERIGLVGRNGHGKSTLFKILAGKEDADSGTIRFPKGYRVGYLSQHIHFTQSTVLQEGCKGLHHGAELDQWKVEKILMGLGFERSDFDRDPHEFSGGYQLRINLAKTLVNEPDLLLLDEPTNFLDIVSIRWMIKFLRNWPSEMILISHDRHFMDQVVTDVMGIHRQDIRKVPGKTQDYYDQIELEETFYESERLTAEKKRQHASEFIDRFRAQATKARQVQSRVKALDKMGTKDKLSRIATLDFSFRSLAFPAKVMLHAHSLSFGYAGQTPLFTDLDINVEKHDRICIIGKNSKGKTTLLKLLMGYLTPVTGTIKTHPLLVKGYFEQAHTAELNTNHTVEAEILSCLTKKSLQEARRLCGLMMFTKDQALKKIEILSGGEKSRVILGKLLATPCHLLLLDEPTHHLDMQSSEAMADAVKNFDGAAIVVTHDENFLRDTATKLIVFHENRTFVYHGTYDEFLNEIGWDDDAPAKTKTPPAISKANRPHSVAQVEKKGAVLKPLQDRIKTLEKSIAAQEKEYSHLTDELTQAATQQNAANIERLSKSLHALRAKIDFAYLDLEKASAEIELAKATNEPVKK